MVAIVWILLLSCDARQSVSKDLVTGLVTRGNGLSCEDVYLTIGEETIQRNTFTYGEEFQVNFNDTEGFERVDNLAFPGMQLAVVNMHGDTLLHYEDLYANLANGTDLSPLLLTAEVTAADPIHSKQEHTLHIHIWDKKGEGTFTAKLQFSVVQDEEIEIQSSGITYNEIYLFSQPRNMTIIDHRAGFDETVYMLFEGLDGFEVERGMVDIGLSLKIEDANGEMIIDEKDLLAGSPQGYPDVNSQLAPNFVISGSEVNNPVTCEIRIWDKKGENSISATTRLDIE
jgi:hypothetical protein